MAHGSNTPQVLPCFTQCRLPAGVETLVDLGCKTLVPTLDALVGIGGHSNAMWSLHPISFKGPEDHVATTKPFISKREKILAWGRDILFQWGRRLEIKLTWISDKPVWVD